MAQVCPSERHPSKVAGIFNESRIQDNQVFPAALTSERGNDWPNPVVRLDAEIPRHDRRGSSCVLAAGDNH